MDHTASPSPTDTTSDHADSSTGTGLARGMRRGPQLATWLRVVVAVLLIGAWFTAGSIGGPYFGKVGEVSSNDQTNYLPTSADATRVQELLPAFNGTDAIPAILVYTSATPLTDAQLRGIADAVAALTDVEGVGESSPPIPSEDGLAVQVFVPLDRGGDVGDEADALRAAATQSAPDGVTVHLTGPAGFASDLSAAFAGIDGLLLLVALLAVLVILVIVYRSPLLPFLVLGTSVFALCAALLTVWWLAKWGVLLLSGQTQGILFILVIGAATDYSLLYVARYREALVTHRTKWDATWAALRGSIEPIAASGGTVIAGLLCLLLSDLKSNSTLGPVAAIGIVFAMLSALTLLPALLYWAGRVAFWPRRTAFDAGHDQETDVVPTTGPWARLSRLVERRPRAIWVVTTIVLAVACLGVLQLKADGVPASDLVLGESDARDGQVALGEHFPGGSGSPVYVVAPQDAFDEVTAALLAEPGVSGVAVTSVDSPSGSATVTNDGVQAFGPPGTPAPEPTLVDGDVLVQATLTDAADSAEAEATVRQIRATLDGIGVAGGQEILVGGVTATAIDTNDASIHDRNLIIPLVLVVIMLILMLLLRSILAPVLLVLTTVLSFGTAMGVSALVFDHVLDLPGADPAVPLFGFVFLVALGIDYNIFLMTRVREESLAHGTREGVMRGLAITGGVITSAGIVLAATFAALGVIPILFLLQLAVIVAFGVLLDTLVVRTLLVPALVHDLGRVVWWPSALSRGKP